jgi:NAD/NADP transhydrogenase beta subunit
MVALTAVPQRTALSHAFGGLAAGLVGCAKYYLWYNEEGGLTTFRTVAIIVEVILGFLTLTGSLMAAGKLMEWLPTRPITYRNQNLIKNIRNLRRRNPIHSQKKRSQLLLMPKLVNFWPSGNKVICLQKP